MTTGNTAPAISVQDDYVTVEWLEVRGGRGPAATGIEVPPQIMDALGGGKKPAVTVTLNGYAYRSTIGVMGGQQIASVGKVIQVQMSYLQFPAAAANAVVLLAAVLMMILGLTRVIDLRKEL